MLLTKNKQKVYQGQLLKTKKTNIAQVFCFFFVNFKSFLDFLSLLEPKAGLWVKTRSSIEFFVSQFYCLSPQILPKLGYQVKKLVILVHLKKKVNLWYSFREFWLFLCMSNRPQICSVFNFAWLCLGGFVRKFFLFLAFRKKENYGYNFLLFFFPKFYFSKRREHSRQKLVYYFTQNWIQTRQTKIRQ